MKKIYIKLPDQKIKKFRLAREGWKSRRFLTASGLLNRLEADLKKLNEKTAVVFKEFNGKKYEIINESLDSTDTDYINYCTLCFLEDYLTKELFSLKSKHAKALPDDI